MSEILYYSTGVLKYHKGDFGYKLIVEIEQAIVDYYRVLITEKTNKQLYPAHISVVRKEIPPNLEFWGKYEGQEVEFCYSPEIHRGTVYYWLNCFCNKLEEIRIELGLPVSSEFTRPSDGFLKCFHTTIANTKSLR